MKIRTSEVSGRFLDWAVAKARGLENSWLHDYKIGYVNSPSTNWAQGGPIYEHEEMEIGRYYNGSNKVWYARMPNGTYRHGATPLIAAMRCFVASKLGEEVDVPDELIS